MAKFIYKICNTLEWSTFKKKKIFYGTKKDLTDGYIHFSERKQVKQTLKKYYFKKKKLILLKVKTLKLKNLFWEESKSNIEFPHLYSNLSFKNVTKSYRIHTKKNGHHKILLKY
jgi:uncharacterized protein (DUF952 family)